MQMSVETKDRCQLLRWEMQEPALSCTLFPNISLGASITDRDKASGYQVTLTAAIDVRCLDDYCDHVVASSDLKRWFASLLHCHQLDLLAAVEVAFLFTWFTDTGQLLEVEIAHKLGFHRCRPVFVRDCPGLLSAVC